MEKMIFKKAPFWAMICVFICSFCLCFGIAASEPMAAMAAGGCYLPDVSLSNADGYAVAMAAAVPAFDVKNLTVVTRQEFEALRAKYGKLYVIDIEIDETESYQYILRRPTRQHLEMIESHVGDTSKINDIIIKNLVVAGDPEALDDGVVFAAFNSRAGEIIQQASVFFSKA